VRAVLVPGFYSHFNHHSEFRLAGHLSSSPFLAVVSGLLFSLNTTTSEGETDRLSDPRWHRCWPEDAEQFINYAVSAMFVPLWVVVYLYF